MSHPSAVSPVTPTPAQPVSAWVVGQLSSIVGTEHVLHDAGALRTYASDALATFAVEPGVVVLPGSTEEVVEVVKTARQANLPIVPRGSGTGLSGGALPVSGCVLVGLSRMKRILEVDLANGWMRVQPGVINLDVSKHISPAGYYYAPDPSSQSVCSIGGNLAENSGGAHCLKYGFTVNHVLAARLVTYDGTVVDLGSPVPDTPGFDLLGVLVGSEGLIGIVTEVTLRILRKPEATRTFFATFPSTTEAGNCVSEIIGSGIVPAAIEMMDRLAIEAAKAATGVDWPDVGAALLMDVDGTLAEAEHTSQKAVELARQSGALEVRVPKDDEERMLMWKGRKSAFAAVGRISPNYLVQDGVIPRTAIAEVLAEITRLSTKDGLRVANVFHAGDGNLHPLVLFDAKLPGEEKRAEALAGEILRICLRHGGSITGEHGVGADKSPYMAEMFTEADLETMAHVRCAFDPEQRFNPGKVFPTPRLCGDRPGIYRAHPTELAGLAERV
jgi:glycolate oxidase